MKKEKFRVGEGISEQISKNRRNVKEKVLFMQLSGYEILKNK